MHLRFIQRALFAGVSFLLVHSASAIDPMPDNTPGVTPTATVAPLPTIPPTPTAPPIPAPPPPPTVSPTPEIEPQPIDTPTPPAPATTPGESPSPSPPLPYEPPLNTPSPPPTPDPGTIIDPGPIETPTPTIPPLPSPTPDDPGPTPFPTPWVSPPPDGIEVSQLPSPNVDEVIPVIVTYGDGLETRADIVQGLMLPVGVPRQKSVTVSLFLPASYAGQVVKLATYDGGLVGAAVSPGVPIAPPGTRTGGIEALTFILNVARDGTVHFSFESGALYGRYRVGVAVGPERYLLQFQAVKPRQPQVPIDTNLPSPTPSPTVHPIVTPQPPPIG